MDSDEIKLWQTMRKLTDSISTVDDIIIELNIDRGRAEEILTKWTRKGIYSHGPNIFAGWIIEQKQIPDHFNVMENKTHVEKLDGLSKRISDNCCLNNYGCR